MKSGRYLLQGFMMVLGIAAIFVFMNAYVFDYPEPSILLIGLVNWGLAIFALIFTIIYLKKHSDANCTKDEEVKG